MKKSKTVIGLGIFYIITSLMAFRTFFEIDHSLIFGFVASKYYATSWYLFWSLCGLAIGIGFLKHKYIFWKIAILQTAIQASGLVTNMFFASNEKLSIVFDSTLAVDAYRRILLFALVIYLLLFGLIISQKKAFTQHPDSSAPGA